ncbi:MAG: hypothetical protein K8S87_01845 [Planctomycetes bacterium]|nr:hypothetical protein [Planctomycetota bacterium]
MNLFNIELNDEKQTTVSLKVRKSDRLNSDLKYFRRHLGLILDAYLCRKISFLTYIEKVYEIHRKFNRKGFSKKDLNRGKERFLRQRIVS